ncbi:ThiF family adenylyltransferase [Burkholderia vietnamiensis]|uniref:ThiF family adenylyltransferase n=1 Tax=Burkholderia vietnamiensis TaxID=60552 RepID=UPI001B9DC62A|nr:ThiF family adenylyltransferase [Burkholderia vietnamiensis]MBR8031893.1 ThiF family adenylyltransferase [Burkholderia vietnamiensis]
MSAALFNRNPDLKRLWDEGYQIRVENGNLVMHEVPYLNARGEIKTGKITSTLLLSGDTTQKPEPHTVHFEGEFPCDTNGKPLSKIAAGNQVPADLHALMAHYLSTKPDDRGYTDYYQKMTTYTNIISSCASAVDNTVSARKVWQALPDEESIFNYLENASGRAGIEKLTDRLSKEKIAILGVGGTGSYILDQIAKTPVREIRLIDGDEFLQHNAFRAPGAPTIDQLREVPKKVDYFRSIYSNMHRGITAHAVAIDETSVHLLDGITFAFLCMDAGQSKRIIVERLERMGVPFIDVGMGLDLTDGTLGGILRVTLSTPQERQYARSKISFEERSGENLYGSNIQVADLNALNAALAVIRWKRYLAFYRDLEGEFNSLYTVDGNCLANGEADAAP